MTMGWSRACYVELVRRADTAAFIQCHANAFEYLGGVPRRCLYDNAKVVTLAGTMTSGRCGTSGCWTSPCRWDSRSGSAVPTGPRPRARSRAASSTSAHFPFQRNLEQFDFALQPSIDERQSLPP